MGRLRTLGQPTDPAPARTSGGGNSRGRRRVAGADLPKPPIPRSVCVPTSSRGESPSKVKTRGEDLAPPDGLAFFGVTARGPAHDMPPGEGPAEHGAEHLDMKRGMGQCACACVRETSPPHPHTQAPFPSRVHWYLWLPTQACIFVWQVPRVRQT